VFRSRRREDESLGIEDGLTSIQEMTTDAAVMDLTDIYSSDE